MSFLQAGPLRVRTLGPPGAPSVLLCHGYGAPGDDLVPLARVIDAGTSFRWFFPEAPLEIDLGYGISGRAWWPLDMERIQRAIASGRARSIPFDEVPVGMSTACDALAATVDALITDHGVDPRTLVVGGFSQGSMVTTDLAVRRVHPFCANVILSGVLVAADRWRKAIAEHGRSLTVFQSHGRSDPLLPFPLALALRAMLEEGGARVDFLEFDGGHEIQPAVLQRLATFLRSVLLEPAP